MSRAAGRYKIGVTNRQTQTMPSACAYRDEPCDRPATGRGLCHPHYMKAQRNGALETYARKARKPAPALPAGTRLCEIPGCGRKYKTKGLCQTHANIGTVWDVSDHSIVVGCSQHNWRQVLTGGSELASLTLLEAHWDISHRNRPGESAKAE